MPPPSQPFSRRHGYVGRSNDITIREGAPEGFRYLVVETARDVGCEPFSLRSIVCRKLGVTPHYQYEQPDGAWKEIQTLMYECLWFKVYDIIEAFYSRVLENEAEAVGRTSESYGHGESARFADSINEFCVEHGIGWQLLNGEIVTRGNEAFEGTVRTAVAVLEEDDKPTAASHLRFAISALSTRPKPNTSGAVAHATSAVECVLGEITGATMTLGEYLNRNPGLFHPALKKGLHGIYGYATDEGARHGKEGTEPAGEDAEFAIATCAAVCTLLTRKRPK